MSVALVEEILAAAGKPIAGETLSVKEMRQAVAEGRVLTISVWGYMGDSDAAFDFATTFGLAYEGGVGWGYLVFPRPIPPALRRSSSTWDEADEIYAAFGIKR